MDKKSNFTHLMRIFAVVAIAIVVITVISRIVNNVNDKVDSIGGGTKATSTTETEATTIAPSDCTNHEYKNGACIKCGTVCAHEESATGDTGNSYCTVCGTLTALKAPMITVTGNVITWEANPDATSYTVYIGDEIEKITEPSYTFTTETAGNYTICVQATNLMVVSEKSNSYTFTYYEITTDSENKGYVVSNSDLILRGETYYAKIEPYNGFVLPSEVVVTMGGTQLSDGYTYDNATGELSVENVTGALYISFDVVSGLPGAPTLTLSGSVVSWPVISGATDYRVRVLADDASFDKYFEITSTSFDISSSGITTEGLYHVSVWANNDYGFGEASAVDYTYVKGYRVTFNEEDNGYIAGAEFDAAVFVVKPGEDYTARIVANTGYLLPVEIYVTMGGVELTEGVTYDDETGVFTIENVTGDLYITYDAISETPAVPTNLKIENGTLSWTTVFGATSYKIRVLSQGLETVFDKYYEVEDTVGGGKSIYTMSTTVFRSEITEVDTYYIAVWGVNEYAEGEAASIQYTPQQLAAPTLAADYSNLTVDAYSFGVYLPENAEGVWVYLNGEQIVDGVTVDVNTTNRTATVVIAESAFADGENTVQIAACAVNAFYLESELVTVSTVSTLEQLAAPAASIEGDILTIEDDGTAEEYEIYVDGVLVATVAAGNSAAAALSYYYSGDNPNYGVYYSADGGDWTLLNNADGVTNVQCSTIKFKIEDIASSGEVCWSTDVNDYTGYESFCCVDDTCIDYVSYADGWFYTDEIPISGTVVIKLCSGSGNVPI